MTRVLPAPTRPRWQPLRAGVVDLFYYDNEEFRFRDGRLLLRGNNGTGKSKVLALTLPFLLDGSLAPHRVEPDADPRKRMEWNLLLGGNHPYPERLGYTWLEFGHLDEHGEPVFRTFGCGLKAVSGKGVVRHWFFVTTRRPGDDLYLVDATGTALTRERLVEALADHGTVYDRAGAYRRAVDECLFGLGEQRYTALVDLLVQLRQPQLSKRPSEKALSTALTEALPPLDQAVVTDVAEAFRSLEEDREALAAMTRTEQAARSFLQHYGRYARVAAKRRAARPRSAQQAYEEVNRRLNEADADYKAATQLLTAAEQRLSELETEHNRLDARERALRDSPEMRSAAELERAGDDVARCRDDAGRAEADMATATERLDGLRDRHDDATGKLGSAEAELAETRDTVGASADAAGVGGEHASQVGASLDDAPDVPRLRQAAEQIVARQRRAVRHVSHLLDAVADAAAKVVEARTKVDDLQADADHLAEQRAAAEQAVAERGAELVARARSRLTQTRELRLPDPAGTLAALELWVETLDGPNPAVRDATEATRTVTEQLARADADLAADARAAEERIDQLTAEIDRLERGEDTAPPSPYTRDADARTERPGAPLWQLVDFADHVDPTDRAGVEAALEASGLLDAWVTPHGELLSADTDDVIVRAGIPAAGDGLTDLLVPAVDRDDPSAAAVSDGSVRALLASIGVGGGDHTWVGIDGRFHLGVLDGAWHKPVATYIGRGARDAARRARLVELRAELATVREQLTGVEEERATLVARKELLAEELAALPDDADLRATHATVAGLVAEGARLTGKQQAAEAALTAAGEEEQRARTTLAEAVDDTGLPAEREELQRVDDALHDYRRALAELWPAVRRRQDAVELVAQLAGDLRGAETELAKLAERASAARLAHAAATERYATLQSTVGAAVDDLLRQLAEVGNLQQTNGRETKKAAGEKDRALELRGEANGRLVALTADLEAASEERRVAAESFRRFADTGLLTVALPELDVPDRHPAWAPDPTVRLARRVNDELSDVADDDATWDRAHRQLNNELKTLQDTLSEQGHRAAADLRDDGIVVEVEFRGRPTSVPELTEALTVEVADRGRLLDEREREVLENHLVSEVASTLQELIFAADAQVEAMNAELRSRPTSTGMRLRLIWEPRHDGPVGLAQARKRLLRQTADAWPEDDRAAVGEFLQQRIAEVRSRDESGGTWLEHLTEALDYRAWHHFVIQRHQNGQWRPATGPASGGERVLAASVPLFAAASSHYASANNPRAPRIVTLDEAFAGVDDNARASYFGLLAAFDLDVVMTSEREWGCYPELPGLAISQLSRRDDVDAVLVTNWEWDGVRRTKAERDVRPVSDNGATDSRDGLWG